MDLKKKYTNFNDWLTDVQELGHRITFFYPDNDEELSNITKDRNIFNIELFFDYYAEGLSPIEAMKDFWGEPDLNDGEFSDFGFDFLSDDELDQLEGDDDF